MKTAARAGARPARPPSSGSRSRLPSVVAPTWRLTTLDSARGVVLFDQHDWSWGRSQLVGADGSAVAGPAGTPSGSPSSSSCSSSPPLAPLHGLTTSRSISVAAAVASAALLGRMSTTVADRLGRTVRDDVHGLAATGASTSAGALDDPGRRRAPRRRGAHGGLGRRVAPARRLGRAAACPRGRRSGWRTRWIA